MIDMQAVNPIKEATMPLAIAGSNKFGRYPKISSERTYNMFLADGWNVPTPGHLKIVSIDPLQEGRGIFTSTRGNFMLVVIGENAYIVNDEIRKYGREIPIGDISENITIKVGTLDTFSGDVFIDENDAEQIAICDKKDMYIYDYQNNTFIKAVLDFLPGYVTFQDGYFIAPDLERPQWRLSAINNGLSWPAGAANVGSLQTKPDNARACVRMPGKGNQLFVMGSSVTESWNNLGYKLFPYNRTSSFNIDYGCLNQSSIAKSDKFIIWLGQNEDSSPVIMMSDGGPERQISTDGINFALSQLTAPEDCYGFLWKNDGHLFYQLTFRTDEITHLYDFNTDKFYFFTNEALNNHIAKKITFFANDYYFISFIDGDLYRLSADISSYDGNTIPRVRITNTIRAPRNDAFIAREMGFTLEQGDSTGLSRLDMSLSYDGGVVFGNAAGSELQNIPNRKNIFRKRNLGKANELTVQLKFWGNGKYLCKDGYMEIYK